MTKFGLFDRAQKALLHVFDTHEEAEAKRIEADVKTALVVPLDDNEAPVLKDEEPGQPSAPQEEVRVVGNAPQEAAAAPAEETPAADPEVAADVSA